MKMRTNLPLVLRHIITRVSSNYNLLLALLIVCISSVVLLVYRHTNPNKGAEQYYKNEHKSHGAVLYGMMQVCYVIIVASVGFNARYILFEAVSAATAATATTVASMASKKKVRL